MAGASSTHRSSTGRAAVAAAALVLAGCTAAPTGSSPMGGAMGGPRDGSTGGVGMAAPLSCQAPTGLAGQRVTVTLVDMGMSRMMGGIAPTGARMLLVARPATVRAGPVSIVVENSGWRTHELVVLPLAAGAVAGQRVPLQGGTVDESASLGEASASCAAGEGEGIVSGAVGWLTVTLAAGHYELVCNLENHYSNGMRQELVVTG